MLSVILMKHLPFQARELFHYFSCRGCMVWNIKGCRAQSTRTESETKYDNSNESLRLSELKGVIGLEIHAQISTKTKLFSGSPNKFGGAVNTNVAYLDASLPGTLPVLNIECVKAGVKTALALNCHVQKVSKFDRKHYFYADLPAGYQITQQRKPLAINGRVDYVVYNPSVVKVPYEKSARIIQLQLEQDSGKSLHNEEGGYSLIDLNRAGTGLMEIVTDADFLSGEEAASFVKELHNILTKIQTCDGKMAEGSMRVDANISVHVPGEPFGVRTEVKNINSIRNVAKAIEFEIQRQVDVINQGGVVTNETRSFDMESGETVTMRDKEIKQDYRFMPEPNLPPLRLYDDKDDVKGVNSDKIINIDSFRSYLPELPAQQRNRLMQLYDINLETCVFLVNTNGISQYFEGIMELGVAECKIVLTVLKLELMYFLNEREMTVEKCPFSVEQLGAVSEMLQKGSLSHSIIGKTLNLMFENPTKSLSEVAEENKLFQITDPEVLGSLCEEVISKNQKLVKKYQEGKVKNFQKLVTIAMKLSEEKANGKLVVEIMKKRLDDK